jgi:hypothetical protein
MDYIHKYIIRHPNGGRADAALELGEQILHSLRFHAMLYDLTMKDLPELPAWAKESEED